MISVLVIDDEPLARQAIVTRLLAHRDVVVRGEYADGSAALEAIHGSAPDLLFVDVQMPGMSGLELLAALPVAQRPLSVLLTAHASFAVDAFALGAVDYLLKPIDPMRFDEALARSRERLAWRGAKLMPEPSNWPERFAVRVGRAERYVAVAKLSWIEADGDYVTLHGHGSGHLLRQSLHELEKQLDPARFVRVHRSAIVSIEHIAELKPMTNRDAVLRLRDGTPVRVSRTYIDALMSALRNGTGKT